MAKQQIAQNPLILRFHRLMDAFAKSDDERDFYLDKKEGFLLYADLEKTELELAELEKEIAIGSERYCLIPKMTFYETKKFMEGFVNEKVYDIDTKEKLLDVIQSKEARENFLEFIYDHLTELEKWQQYYQERSRIRIIEWLRQQQIQFVFEEDLEMTKTLIEKLKRHLFDTTVAKDVVAAREMLSSKSKTYYSSEALNPRPKRGRPPKQVAKVEVEPQVTLDLYTTVPLAMRSFLFLPEITTAAGVTFSARYDTAEQLLANLRGSSRTKVDAKLEALSQRLESLRHLSAKLTTIEDITGTDREGRLIHAVSKGVHDAEESVEDLIDETRKPRKLLDVVQGFLPRKKEKKKQKEEIVSETPIPIKTVTQIHKKGPKK